MINTELKNNALIEELPIGTVGRCNLEFSLMLRISRWNCNYGTNERLSKELFIKNFGNRLGEHYFDKWASVCEQKFMNMITYLGLNDKDGVTFCNMVNRQMQEYEKRLKL